MNLSLSKLLSPSKSKSLVGLSKVLKTLIEKQGY
ncbi:hypothetical protein PanWU01x14_192490 [Parasponia andersonii]|uniref:Uncharacterized protein n=1 Tax=Parasponia andersonii TaxID=3476 RepID=A0A2P5C101_PARAD|nr:hypothetical protein PanWU01x14_192490 [Parasponia andersonii]